MQHYYPLLDPAATREFFCVNTCCALRKGCCFGWKKLVDSRLVVGRALGGGGRCNGTAMCPRNAEIGTAAHRGSCVNCQRIERATTEAKDKHIPRADALKVRRTAGLLFALDRGGCCSRLAFGGVPKLIDSQVNILVGEFQ